MYPGLCSSLITGTIEVLIIVDLLLIERIV